MNEKVRVNLDGLHSLDITIREDKKTIITELVLPDEPPELIYAEKFDEPCNYLKTAIKRGLLYLDGKITVKSEKINPRVSGDWRS